MKYQSILETIGHTPHLRLNRLFPNHDVWLKLERTSPGGSIKDRVALAMIEDAEKQGILTLNTTIIEPTSGNTGVGLALVAAVRGYKLILVMPESMSVERRTLMQLYGAKLVLTPKELGMKGAIEKAKALSEEITDSWIPQQFENPANPRIHEQQTAQEILQDFPEGFDYFVSGVGTGGHISGIGKVLHEKFKNIKIIAVEPELSPVLSGGNAGPHAIQGIGAGFIPENLNVKLLHKIIQVGNQEAVDWAKKAATVEGVLCGISTGASLCAVSKLIIGEPSSTKILTVNYDTGERYLSVFGN